MVGRLLRELADLLDPPPKPARRTPSPIDFSAPTLFERDEGRDRQRRLVAMSLLDDDVIGYVVMRVRRSTAGVAHVDLDVAADDPFWPALSETAARLVLEGDRVFQG